MNKKQMIQKWKENEKKEKTGNCLNCNRELAEMPYLPGTIKHKNEIEAQQNNCHDYEDR